MPNANKHVAYQKHSRYKYIQFHDPSVYRRFIDEESSSDTQTAGVNQELPPDASSHGTYGAFLFHPKWKEKRKEILTRDNYRCVNCKSDKELQIHHRQYHFIVSQNQFRLPWDYPGHLLITLCQSCHARGHNKFKVPTINV